ncbi:MULTISPECIES: ribonuclease [unclassified Sphingomonas]|uniref:ribonuclease n=1 Tax=unclassified Sphingomonas TaxID=196159 RepID=UPI00226A1263|nr:MULTISPECIES: ribonuclease [unclassified Sphingomonas]
MPEWLYEAGIGESRAALVDDDRIIEAAIELDGALRLGTVARAKLVEVLPGRSGRLDLGGTELLLPRVPAGITQGATLTVEIVREALPEAGRAKPPRAVAVDPATPPADGPDLLARLTASGHPVRHVLAHQPDALEAAGWSELLDEATSGEIAFPLGSLRMSPTPAMTLFDVDGPPPLESLALAAARAVAEAIRRHAVGGSIGIDFPTLAGKAPRLAVADMIDTHLPMPFERTAVNGFGFLQIVRPRPRASLPEGLRADPVGAAARAALRTMERVPVGAPRQHRLAAPVYAYLHARPAWLAALARRTGVAPLLESA